MQNTTNDVIESRAQEQHTTDDVIKSHTKKIPTATAEFRNITEDDRGTYTATGTLSQPHPITPKGPDALLYEWEPSLNAWFPKHDEQRVKLQQSAYAVDGIDENEPVLHVTVKRKLFKQAQVKNTPLNHNKTAANPTKPIVKKKNTAVYVSGLPLSTSSEEIVALFGKYGVISEDIDTGDAKVKLYKDEHGHFKGDALVVYFKEESVQLACNMLDDTDFRFGETGRIRVQPAVFQEKNNENKHVYSKSIIKSKLKHMQNKLDWDDAKDAKKLEKLSKSVILKHMFTQQELLDDPTLLLDLKVDVREECEKIGPVTNVILYDTSEEGIMAVKFKETQHALECVRIMDKRYFSGRRVVACLDDGLEEYRQKPIIHGYADDDDDDGVLTE